MNREEKLHSLITRVKTSDFKAVSSQAEQQRHKQSAEVNDNLLTGP